LKNLRILQNVIEQSFINERVPPLVKINTRISDTPCISNNKLVQSSSDKSGTILFFEGNVS
jgi:hypothetical protein